MAPSLKAVFESLAPGNLYDICLYDAPIRQSATRDIGGRNFDDRQRSRGMPCQAEADITHDCAPDTGMGFCPRAASLAECMAMMVDSKPSLHHANRRPCLPFAPMVRVIGSIF